MFNLLIDLNQMYKFVLYFMIIKLALWTFNRFLLSSDRPLLPSAGPRWTCFILPSIRTWCCFCRDLFRGNKV